MKRINKFLKFAIAILCSLLLTITYCSPTSFVYASSSLPVSYLISIRNANQSSKYIIIANKIIDLDYKATHTFKIKTVGLKTTNIIWSSSNKSIATVSKTGKVTARSAGSVTITAKDKISGKKTTCTFRVRQKETNASYFRYKIKDNNATITKYIGPDTITDIVIPRYLNNTPVSTIGNQAFYETKIVSIDIPSTITKISSYSFYGCNSLKEVFLPSSVTTVDEGAFAKCSSLTTCSMPNKMKKLGNYVFSNCSSLNQVILPTTCNNVGEYLFNATPLGFLSNLEIASGLKSSIFLTSEENEVYKKMKTILSNLISKSDTDVEKVKKVHDWIILNCTYNENPSSDDSFSCMGLIKNHTAVCAGYAETFQVFMNLLGIECITITGEALDENKKAIGHAWNAVNLDHEWYQIDVTWDDPTPDIGNISYNYFLVTNKIMSQKHIWNTDAYPLATSDKFSYYVYEDYICTTKDEIRTCIQSQLKKEYEWIMIVIPENSKDLESVLFEMKKPYLFYDPYMVGTYQVNRITFSEELLSQY